MHTLKVGETQKKKEKKKKEREIVETLVFIHTIATMMVIDGSAVAVDGDVSLLCAPYSADVTQRECSLSESRRKREGGRERERENGSSHWGSLLQEELCPAKPITITIIHLKSTLS